MPRALVMGVALLGAWFAYERYANGETHLQILAIIAAMALTKLAAMAYYLMTG